MWWPWRQANVDVRALIEAQLRGSDRASHQLNKLVHRREPETLRALVAMWADANDQIRFWSMTYAAPMLRGDVGISELGELLAPLLRDPLPANKQLAMVIFQRQHDFLPLELLQLVVENVADTHVHALRTLGRVGAKAVPHVSILIDALNAEETWSVAATALAQLRDVIPSEFADVIATQAREHPSEVVRSGLEVIVTSLAARTR